MNFNYNSYFDFKELAPPILLPLLPDSSETSDLSDFSSLSPISTHYDCSYTDYSTYTIESLVFSEKSPLCITKSSKISTITADEVASPKSLKRSVCFEDSSLYSV